MRTAESAPQVWRLTHCGLTKEFKGVKERVILQNPGALEIIFFRDKPYVRDEEGKLQPASGELTIKLRDLELRKRK